MLNSLLIKVDFGEKWSLLSPNFGEKRPILIKNALKIDLFLRLIKGFNLKKQVHLAPSFCGEGYFSSDSISSDSTDFIWFDRFHLIRYPPHEGPVLTKLASLKG